MVKGGKIKLYFDRGLACPGTNQPTHALRVDTRLRSLFPPLLPTEAQIRTLCGELNMSIGPHLREIGARKAKQCQQCPM